MNPGETIDAIFNHYIAYKPLVVKVEAIAYQRTLVYWIKKRQEKLNLPFYVEAIKGMSGSKVDRIKGLQPYFAASNIMIKSEMEELERELISFPLGAHDDIIDSLSMQVGFWYQIGEQEKTYRKSTMPHNAMTGQAIIDEILGRSKKLNEYPYDMGIMADAVRHEELRSYQYA